MSRRRIRPGGHSVKPGRGPSLGGMVGGLIAIVFGIFWTVMAFNLTRHVPFGAVRIFFPLFGVLFVVGAIASMLYHAYNAFGDNRFSDFDIVPSDEEPDPLSREGERREEWDSGKSNRGKWDSDLEQDRGSELFCTHCGARVASTDNFCRACGKPQS